MEQRSKWPIIGIYITHEDKKGFLNYVNFHTKTDALLFLKDLVTVQGTPDPIKDDLLFESGWRLSTRDNSSHNDLPRLLEQSHSVSGKPIQSYNHWPIFGNRPIDTSPKPPPQSKRTPRSSDLLTLQDIHPDPREARQILRQAKVTKPTEGWCWSKDSETLQKVKKILKVS